MSIIITGMDIPESCSDCQLCIYTADEKRAIGYCNTSDDDYYCKALKRFMEYDEVEGGVDILGKPNDCPLKSVEGLLAEISKYAITYPSEEEKLNEAYNQGLVTAMEIIKEYCEVRQMRQEDNKMSNEEAIKIIGNIPVAAAEVKMIEALDMAIQALEKRTPQMVVYQKEPTNDYSSKAEANCPYCYTTYTEYTPDWRIGYCACCGQALKWGRDKKDE